jgi:hypothetical protein
VTLLGDGAYVIRLRHAVLVVAACIAFSLVSVSLLDGDLQLHKLGFLPDLLRFILAMCMGLGSIIALAVAAWVALYNGAFFFGRITGRKNNLEK